MDYPHSIELAASRMMPRAVAALCLASALLAAAVLPLSAASEPANPAAGTVGALPPVTLADQNGAAVPLASLRGRPVLLGFVHTSCKGPCEMMTAKMKLVGDRLASHHDTKLVMLTITTDPDHDGPAQMLAYARAQNANQPGWLFLSGKPADVRRVLAVYNIVHDESEEDEMTHVLDLFLIAPDGTTVRHYHGTEISPETIASDIRKTLARR